jgi:23S rRNA pseudouridine1911/1915/1917 synthase
VHLAHMGHPLIGDDVYGSGFKTKARHLSQRAQKALDALGRQALHASLLVLEHPASGDVMQWESGLPEDLLLLQGALRSIKQL